MAVSELSVVAFMLSGYALLLFRHSLIPLSFKARARVAALCVAATLPIAVLVIFPNAPIWLALAIVIPWIAVWIGAIAEPVVRFWLVSRDRISSSRNASRLPCASACITGSSGLRVWINTRPGLSPRPERPAT